MPELADPGPPVAPSASVWAGIAAATGVTAAPRAEAPASSSAPSTPPPPAEPVGGQVLPFRRGPRLLLVAAAVAGAVVGAGVVGLVRGGDDVEAVAAVALDALTDEPASGRAEVVLREDGSHALQVDLEAPALDGEYYEL